MKRLFIIGIIFCYSCKQYVQDCKQFKTGRFEYTYTENAVEKTGTIIRSENLQIETYDNKIDSSKIRWVNDCEFVAQILHPKSMADEKPILIKILTTDHDSYTFEFHEIGKEENKKTGTVKKID